MAEVFISYSRSDTFFLNLFVKHLREKFDEDILWFDRQIQVGDDWWKTIVNEIAKCSIVIFLISNEALESEPCQQELREALTREKTILPVVTRRLNPQYPGNIVGDLASYLVKTQYIDMSSELTEEGLEPIRDAIQKARTKKFVKRITGYEIIRQISSGGFSQAYLAHQVSLNREVVVHVLLPLSANRSDFISRFEQESRIVARLEHTHIVPIFDFWKDQSGAYMIMRYMSGGNLADKIQNDGAFSVADASRLLDQIARALHTVHANGIVHQDIKSANILFDNYGDAYLTDFGISYDIINKVNLGVDESNTMHGSPRYISPENLQRKEISARSDIYSLGILM